MKIYSFRWQYTKTFIATFVVATIAIAVFAYFAYHSSKRIIKNEQLNTNSQIITQIYQEIYQSKVDLDTMVMEIYENIEYLERIESIYKIKNEEDDFFNNPFLKQQANEQFKSLMYNIPEVRLVLLYNEETKMLISHNPGLNTWNIVENEKYPEIINQIDNIIKKNHADEIEGISILYSRYDNLKSYVVSSKLGFKQNNLGKSNLFIVYDILRVKNIINEHSKRLSGDICIFNRYGKVIYSSSDVLDSKKVADYIDYSNAYSEKIAFAGNEYFISQTGVYGEDFFTMAFINSKEMAEKYLPVKRSIILICLLVIFIVMLVNLLAIRNFGSKIRRLIDAMIVVGENNLDYRMPIEGKDNEFEAIANRFNKMCKQINDYINREYVYQLKEKASELGYLQSSINPHFLYNTLEAIRQYVDDEKSDREKAGEMVAALATIFRNIVRKDFFITVLEEIELCELILKMYQLRFFEIAKFDIEYTKEVVGYGVVKNILQPMIENYFIHGIDQNREDNYIKISVKKDNEDLVFEIKDNGVGIKGERLKSINKKLKSGKISSNLHYGIANVNERIKIVYGDAYGIEIFENINGGACVKIKIAAQSVEELKKRINSYQEPSFR